MYGASPITEALLDRAMTALPRSQFVQAYGMTELSPVATMLHRASISAKAASWAATAPAGRATFGVQIRIVDADDRPVPHGTVGEIASAATTS